MSDRLAELRRQRALQQEHLAWLDREIAAELEKLRTTQPGAAIAAVVAARATDPAAMVAPVKPSAPVPPPVVDAIIEEYRVPAEDLHTNVKKGCLLYLAAAFALLFVGVVILYFAI